MSTRSASPNIVSIRRLGLRLGLVGLLVFSGLFIAGTASAAGCSITCNGNSCSATGANAECWCHWWSGNPCCQGGGIAQELDSTDEWQAETTRSYYDTRSFAQRGGDFNALLESNLMGFYESIIRELGFSETTHAFIQNFRAVQGHYLEGNIKQFKSTQEELEHAIEDFNDQERDILANLALELLRSRSN